MPIKALSRKAPAEKGGFHSQNLRQRFLYRQPAHGGDQQFNADQRACCRGTSVG